MKYYLKNIGENYVVTAPTLSLARNAVTIAWVANLSAVPGSPMTKCRGLGVLIDATIGRRNRPGITAVRSRKG